MTVNDLKEFCSLEPLCPELSLSKNVSTGYCGDLLSFVIGKAPKDSAWITVMGNENAIAVALLADISCIILAEGTKLDEKAKLRAIENNIPVFGSQESEYNLAVKISDCLNK